MKNDSGGPGIIEFGLIHAKGYWRILNQLLQVTFDMQTLSVASKRMLDHYRTCPGRLNITFPDGIAQRFKVVGFERHGTSTTFFVDES